MSKVQELREFLSTHALCCTWPLFFAKWRSQTLPSRLCNDLESLGKQFATWNFPPGTRLKLAPSFQYSLSVKRDEKQRLEKELREEEMAVQKTESELRLAEQAFDQFLQENDRKAVGAMKRWVLLHLVFTTFDTMHKKAATYSIMAVKNSDGRRGAAKKYKTVCNVSEAASVK